MFQLGLSITTISFLQKMNRTVFFVQIIKHPAYPTYRGEKIGFPVKSTKNTWIVQTHRKREKNTFKQIVFTYDVKIIYTSPTQEEPKAILSLEFLRFFRLHHSPMFFVPLRVRQLLSLVCRQYMKRRLIACSFNFVLTIPKSAIKVFTFISQACTFAQDQLPNAPKQKNTTFFIYFARKRNSCILYA